MTKIPITLRAGWNVVSTSAGVFTDAQTVNPHIVHSLDILPPGAATVDQTRFARKGVEMGEKPPGISGGWVRPKGVFFVGASLNDDSTGNLCFYVMDRDETSLSAIVIVP